MNVFGSSLYHIFCFYRSTITLQSLYNDSTITLQSLYNQLTAELWFNAKLFLKLEVSDLSQSSRLHHSAPYRSVLSVLLFLQSSPLHVFIHPQQPLSSSASLSRDFRWLTRNVHESRKIDENHEKCLYPFILSKEQLRRFTSVSTPFQNQQLYNAFEDAILIACVLFHSVPCIGRNRRQLAF